MYYVLMSVLYPMSTELLCTYISLSAALSFNVLIKNIEPKENKTGYFTFSQFFSEILFFFI